ncbi:GNAT family N-acetyltransferase [Nonomuraea sp. NPDC050556]|uniref:GNAT family N-acetyltransferase n=1 Tax=Nonomuraea sp. NPDC050556 TaxID=3364369 RepID=UPI00379022A9
MFAFIPVTRDDDLAGFLAADDWPFHAGAPSATVADDAQAFWILADGERAGLVKLMDLGDDTPMFDLRVRQAWRGKGAGTAAVAWLTGHLFTSLPGVNRIEGTTRVDNAAMRAVFRKSGYAKESHYRDAWPGRDGTPYDAVGYAILRRDWESGTVTWPDWDDEPSRP